MDIFIVVYLKNEKSVSSKIMYWKVLKIIKIFLNILKTFLYKNMHKNNCKLL